jgi:hypothetical protein
MSQIERSTPRINDFSRLPNRQGTHSVLSQTRQMAEQLQTALSGLATIDQAIGILITRSGGNAEEATAALCEVSRTQDADLATVARQIVEEVSRRSHARHIER